MKHRLGGRPQLIDLDQILEAALALGVDNLSMHAVARRLKVSTTALYRYVKSRDELLDACMDLFCQRIAVPDAELPWDRYLVAVGGAFFAALQATPGASAYGIKIGPTTPAAYRIIEAALTVLERDGFDPVNAWTAFSMVVNHAFYSVQSMEQFAALEAENGPGGYRVMQLGEDAADEFPRLVAVVAAAMSDRDFDRSYRNQLEAIVAGIGIGFGPTTGS